MNRKSLIYLVLSLLIILPAACVESDSTYEYSLSSDVAVNTFNLAADDDILTNLDSVFFTIDLENRLIYNADSLPKGTDVSALIVEMTFPVVNSITLHVTDGEKMTDETIDYSSQATDSIDFTGNVEMTVVSEDLTATAVYNIKVNVHKMDPDSLYWNRVARRDLPSYTLPIAQKTVQFGDKVFCLVQETSQYLMSTISDPAKDSWSKNRVTFDFTPDVNSLTATDDALYILDTDSNLYTSTDGISWTAANAQFYSLLGGYGDELLGVTLVEGSYYHDIYPRPADFTPIKVDDEFPISGTSTPIIVNSKWNSTPQFIVYGGEDRAGKRVGGCWGYDGSVWAYITATETPAVSGAVLFPYYNYETSSDWVVSKYPVLLAIGGFNQGGEPTKTVYISYDNGVTWRKADSLLQLPDYIPVFGNAQAIVISTAMTSRSHDDSVWESYPSKKLPVWCSIVPSVMSRGVEQTWDCPYIYIFGGTNQQGTLYNNVWRGVLNRLSFKPIF